MTRGDDFNIDLDPKPIKDSTKVGDLKGRPLRVVKTGDPVTLDYMPSRVNIEIDTKTRAIVRVWAG